MNIVLLEKETLAYNGDVSLAAFDELGSVTSYSTLCGEELFKAVKNAEVVLINKTQYNKELFDKSPKLKYIGILATGYNNVDLNEANRRNITVCNVPKYSTDSVAQLALTFMLTLASSLPSYDKSVKDGGWIKSPTFSYFPYPFFELKDKTVGIVGYGEIGRTFAKLCLALKMRVLVYTRTARNDKEVTFVDKQTLFKESDFISLHCPLTAETEKLINADTINLMKKTAFIINTSRGGVIDEAALCSALNENKIAGAALDVLSSEPMREDNPLYKAINCIITPHIAWTTREARERLIAVAVENVKAFFEGKIQNKVN